MHPTAAQPTAAPAYAFFDTVAIVRATSEQTMGHYSLVEIRAQIGQQPPLHSHDHDDEGFYILDGEVRLHVGPDTICMGPAQSAVAPRGIPHTYLVESEQATWLVASNGGFDRYVTDIGAPLNHPEQPRAVKLPAMERILEVSAAHGIQILGPPGTLPT